MQKNIDATLRAYNVHQVETREVPATTPGNPRGQIGASLRNIPVWDKEILEPFSSSSRSCGPIVNLPG